jgi:hypothetical protein
VDRLSLRDVGRLPPEYDGEDLLHEPWYLLVPLAASLAAWFGLFFLVWIFTSKESPAFSQSFFKGYASRYFTISHSGNAC